ERAREADALALPAAELVRVARGRVAREPDHLEQLPNPVGRAPAARDEAVDAQRLADDPADAVARVQRRERVLEDHLHPPPQRPELALAEVGDVVPVEDDA